MIHFKPIGTLYTCFEEKFGIPRQSGLVPHATGILKLNNHPFFKTAIQSLEGFSHLWIVFLFHETRSKNWKPSIRPPRLGGAKKIGVLASRSPHRPNPIGLSVVRLKSIHPDAPGGVELQLTGVDCLNETPVLDIKPYLPYCDSIPEATSGWAHEPIQKVPVQFSENILKWIETKVIKKYPDFQSLVKEILELDPRPAFQKIRFEPKSILSQGKRFGFRLFEFDIHWEIRGEAFFVDEIIELSKTNNPSKLQALTPQKP